MKNKEQKLSGVVESQKQTFDALLKKYNNLNATFEKVLRNHVVISELRDLYRQEARCKRNIFIDLQNNVTDLENKNRLLEQRNKDMQILQ